MPHFIGGPRLHEHLAEMRREVFARYDRALFTVGETPLVTVEQARRLCDPGHCGLDMVFSFEHMMADYGASKFDLQPLDLRKLKAIFTRWQEGLAETGWNSLYWANHDQPRRGIAVRRRRRAPRALARSCSPRRSISSAVRRTCIRAKSSG